MQLSFSKDFQSAASGIPSRRKLRSVFRPGDNPVCARALLSFNSCGSTSYPQRSFHDRYLHRALFCHSYLPPVAAANSVCGRVLWGVSAGLTGYVEQPLGVHRRCLGKVEPWSLAVDVVHLKWRAGPWSCVEELFSKKVVDSSVGNGYI